MAGTRDGPEGLARPTQADLEAMTPEDRRAAMLALAGLATASSRLRPPRRRRLTLVMAASVVLAAWTVYIGVTLPDRYVTQNWALAWTGFDVILTLMFAATAVLGLLRRQLVVLAAFTAGVLVLCDAWFDVTTANDHDRLTSIATAALVEVPVAVWLISWSLRLLRTTLAVLLGEPGRLWRVPLLLPEQDPDS